MNRVEYTSSEVETVRQGSNTLNDIVRSPRKLVGWRVNCPSEVAITKLPEPLDEFKCSPNHCNALRQQYINILADLADSDILSDIFSQLHGVKGTYPKLSNNLGAMIRNSNYALS